MSIALAAWMMILASHPAAAAGLSAGKPIKLVGREIEAILDLPKKEVRIVRFSIDKEIPTGKLRHQLAKQYVVRLISIPRIEVDDITTFMASDWYDGIGLKLEIKLYVPKSGQAKASINVTSQHEETTLYYSAQQLEVRQD